MITIDIPGGDILKAEHLVLDYNGTIAVDGVILPGVRELLAKLSSDIQIHVITADTFGRAEAELSGVNCSLKILQKENQQKQKLNFIEELGKERVIAIGNGYNDLLMLKEAGLSISVIQKEGACPQSVVFSDIVTTSIIDALELLINPFRMIATLRN
ncbi:MAG TPA: HAD family hydrolase [Spirochaetota bacterium]|jgi:soluble P-type ATPase|nr:HAD family hydrolase [Spirochaetota bacterium]OQA97562.1 MAG: haloacid dehalogenase-like hydrolase [Spirochaetes bacterium ADurb.Bin218]HOK02816.1 HAD family hydrolase [Spirochaetota bacterium]HOK93013.1 HAD family hydrolase [Spirochaetota bacterium]HOQ12569.1 HAD family hydrolase [Spirochaetota bacterium]